MRILEGTNIETMVIPTRGPLMFKRAGVNEYDMDGSKTLSS